MIAASKTKQVARIVLDRQFLEETYVSERQN